VSKCKSQILIAELSLVASKTYRSRREGSVTV